MICDLAETYCIYDYEQLPLYKVAIFVCGLREDSRTKMFLNGMKINLNQLLLAYAVDSLMYLVWTKTEDAANGINMPEKISSILLGKEDTEDIRAFDNEEDFMKAWNS